MSTKDNAVRLLHLIIAASVLFQLLSSLYMADRGTQYLFVYHEIVGMASALAIAVYWLYAYSSYAMGYLFPWNRAGFKAIAADLAGLAKGRLPGHGRCLGLSGFVHGLGLLAVTGSAVTGAILFSMVPPGHTGLADDPIAFTRYSLDHKFFGTLVWVYVGGHVAFALLHQLAGHKVFGDIFGLRPARAGEEGSSAQ